MKPADKEPVPTRELPVAQLPHCRCGQHSRKNLTGGAEKLWLLEKPEGPDVKEKGLIEYECLACNRHYRLRGNRFCEVMTDGSERPYMRLGQYGRWLASR